MKKKRKFIEPETLMVSAWISHSGSMYSMPIKSLSGYSVPARLITEQEYQKLLRLARRAK